MSCERLGRRHTQRTASLRQLLEGHPACQNLYQFESDPFDVSRTKNPINREISNMHSCHHLLPLDERVVVLAGIDAQGRVIDGMYADPTMADPTQLL